MRTGGWGGGSGSSGGRSWLLIKHRDDWAGDLDITEFAPRSVKSDGDLEDILAADKPDIWVSHRPAKGGETGAMLDAIIKKAAAIKSGTAPATPGPCRTRKVRARAEEGGKAGGKSHRKVHHGRQEEGSGEAPLGLPPRIEFDPARESGFELDVRLLDARKHGMNVVGAFLVEIG